MIPLVVYICLSKALYLNSFRTVGANLYRLIIRENCAVDNYNGVGQN